MLMLPPEGWRHSPKTVGGCFSQTKKATERFFDFFTSTIRNSTSPAEPITSGGAVLGWCEGRGLLDLAHVKRCTSRAISNGSRCPERKGRALPSPR